MEKGVKERPPYVNSILGFGLESNRYKGINLERDFVSLICVSKMWEFCGSTREYMEIPLHL